MHASCFTNSLIAVAALLHSATASAIPAVPRAGKVSYEKLDRCCLVEYPANFSQILPRTHGFPSMPAAPQ
jgi:hypothetical protein